MEERRLAEMRIAELRHRRARERAEALEREPICEALLPERETVDRRWRELAAMASADQESRTHGADLAAFYAGVLLKEARRSAEQRAMTREEELSLARERAHRKRARELAAREEILAFFSEADEELGRGPFFDGPDADGGGKDPVLWSGPLRCMARSVAGARRLSDRDILRDATRPVFAPPVLSRRLLHLLGVDKTTSGAIRHRARSAAPLPGKKEARNAAIKETLDGLSEARAYDIPQGDP